MKKIIAYVEHLRRKPHEEKKHLLHLLTIFFALIVVLLWALSVSNSYKSLKGRGAVQRDFEPLVNFSRGLGEEYQDLSR